MHLVDPKLPRGTRVVIYSVFCAVVLAVLALGAMSIARSVSELTHVSESAAELKHNITEEINEKF